MNRIYMNSDPMQSVSNNLTQSADQSEPNFAKHLKSAIEQVNNQLNLSEQKTKAFAKGDITDLHDMMITAQKANVTLETAVQIQKRAIDAYNEIMRMQI